MVEPCTAWLSASLTSSRGELRARIKTFGRLSLLLFTIHISKKVCSNYYAPQCHLRRPAPALVVCSTVQDSIYEKNRAHRHWSKDSNTVANMGLRDMVKKKEELQDNAPDAEKTIRAVGGPEFTFIRSDTSSVEVIQPPTSTTPQDESHLSPVKESHGFRRSLDVFRSSRSRSASVSSQASHQSGRERGGHRRLSQRLHLSRREESSDKVPENLPQIIAPTDPTDKDGMEHQWEKRATLLAGQNDLARSRPASPSPAPSDGVASMSLGESMQQQSAPGSRSRSPSVNQPTSSAAIDEDIQEAIQLHEEGDLERSTRIFGRLADPEGANNPLSQVLYGLALRFVQRSY